jgi:ubiquinone/menaquinone biosynthesis C-methylase UbiE
MSRMLASIYDFWMRPAEAACLVTWRTALLGDVSGAVLEVGAGTGAMLTYYPMTVTRLVLAEPDAFMRRRLEQKCRTTTLTHVEVSSASLERLTMSAASFDAVVCTLVLCSVPSLQTALAEIYRVLKPGGQLLFLEHVGAEPTSARFSWQRRLEPVWKRVAGNCHLTRRTEQAITAAGFQVERITRESMRKAMPFIRPCIRGSARKPRSGHASVAPT